MKILLRKKWANQSKILWMAKVSLRLKTNIVSPRIDELDCSKKGFKVMICNIHTNRKSSSMMDDNIYILSFLINTISNRNAF